MSLIEFENNEDEYSAIIKVVGVGGGGTNAVNSMVRDNIRGVEFIIANTDLQSLEKSEGPEKVQLGGELTRGLGAGSNPDIGRNAAEESENIIRDMLVGSDMVFVRFFQVVFELEPAAVGFGRDLRQILKCPWDYWF